eukprot:CAMPEP_0202729446 /NCGR_PEP_ID=MMETSP1385-20130828/186137_1 /ASSEMBLY_ACC=CAM_ASM_000861 /TAXON_ID=933848 /ORGANISM="Elphidium margaritaceum" /LENGTH=307 /DNA_ID=CAMNT_0049395707 /DNA_START=508 /DNA_END=1434 /DNA_ORIENTATION=-
MSFSGRRPLSTSRKATMGAVSTGCIQAMFIDYNNKHDGDTRYDTICAYVISHANHCCDPSNRNRQKIYLLDEQIRHKTNCIRYIIEQETSVSGVASDDCDFIMGGHSIGAFMALKMLPQFKRTQFRHVILWAPTIVNLAQSDNGRRLNWLYSIGLLSLLPVLQTMVSRLIPKSLIHFLLEHGLYAKHKVVRDVTCTNSRSLSNVLRLAKDEFEIVRSLKETGVDKLLLEYKDKLIFYWAKHDGWAHRQCRLDICHLFDQQNDEQMQQVMHNRWIVDEDLKHALMVDDMSKNIEYRLSQRMISWIMDA